MLLVTGPTGSGKTTTLYAAISETLTGKDKIIGFKTTRSRAGLRVWH